MPVSVLQSRPLGRLWRLLAPALTPSVSSAQPTPPRDCRMWRVWWTPMARSLWCRRARRCERPVRDCQHGPDPSGGPFLREAAQAAAPPAFRGLLICARLLHIRRRCGRVDGGLRLPRIALNRKPLVAEPSDACAKNT